MISLPPFKAITMDVLFWSHILSYVFIFAATHGQEKLYSDEQNQIGTSKIETYVKEIMFWEAG